LSTEVEATKEGGVGTRGLFPLQSDVCVSAQVRRKPPRPDPQRHTVTAVVGGGLGNHDQVFQVGFLCGDCLKATRETRMNANSTVFFFFLGGPHYRVTGKRCFPSSELETLMLGSRAQR